VPLVIAHRGASAGRPGNTLEAFERAIGVGADMIEFDVRRTRLGELVVFHDPLVHGLPIARLSREEIGARTDRTPPLLDEVVELAAGRVMLDVELKEGGYVAQVLDVLDGRVERDELLVTSFHTRVLQDVRRHRPQARTGLVLGISNAGSVAPVARARRCGARCILLRRRFAERGLVERAHAAGLQPMVWTVNDDEGLRRHLGDPHVAGVITDVPERAVQLRGQGDVVAA
jgi:glycerophosphoryl diester phosphodiesterase